MHVAYPVDSTSTTDVSSGTTVTYLSDSTKVSRFLAHCISPLRMNVRSQIGRDSSDVDAFGHDTFLYSDCSIRIYFGDGERTVAQRVHFTLQGVTFQHDFIVYVELALDAFTILLFIVG